MDDPGFIFYPGDYLRDTQCLSEKSQVAYDRIMCEHMRNICISKQQLNFFTKRLTDDEKSELMFTLTEIDGGFQIKWVAESIAKRRNYSESRRNNRKKPNKKSETVPVSYDNHVLSHDEHMDNEIEDENEDINKEGKEVTGEKGTKKKEKKQVPELQYPFTSELFIETWNILVSTPKWKKKIPHSLQLALNSLGKYNEEFSIMLMNKAIENGWQGVTYADTDEQYQKWLKSNGNSEIRTTGNSVGKITAGNNAADKVASVGRLADMAETILQNLVPKNV